jgi:putative proteasome-type protease
LRDRCLHTVIKLAGKGWGSAMTYCVGVRVMSGLVLLSDTRTNAGMDNISRFGKMYSFENPGERVIALLTAGNLSITQSIISRLRRAIQRVEEEDSEEETILNCKTMFRVAQLIGAEMRKVQSEYREALLSQNAQANASILLAGQRKGGIHRLYLIYSAGNFIEATRDTPFFQIGEHKYGKPILDRVITPECTIDDALKAVCVSMDSTLRSNLSVGMPLDLAVIPKDVLGYSVHRRIEASDPKFAEISQSWGRALHREFAELPSFLD